MHSVPLAGIRVGEALCAPCGCARLAELPAPGTSAAVIMVSLSALDAALAHALKAPTRTLEALLSGQVGPVEAGTASEGVTGATASGTGLACAIAECVGGCTGEARVEVGASGAPA